MIKKQILCFVFIFFSLIHADNYYKELTNNINLFFDVYRNINSRYVDTVDTDKFIKTGIKSMLNTLDPYTVLMGRGQKEHFKDLTTGSFSGIGVHLGLSGKEKWLTVISPINDTPAYRAGIKSGDRLIKIDSVDTKGFLIKDASKYLRGEPGSIVNIVVRRPGGEIVDFKLRREIIKIKNVPYYGVIENGVGYVKISSFSRNTVSEVRTIIEGFKKQGVNSTIIDLRYNPGGLLDAAVDLSGLFMDKGTVVVKTKGRNEEIKDIYKTGNSPVAPDMSIAILINGASASSSEVFSGAMQDYDRGIIVGETSFGKGLVQQIYQLDNDNSIKITTAKYYTPSGRLIQKTDYFSEDGHGKVDTIEFKTSRGRIVKSGVGIVPDVEVKDKDHTPYVRNLIRKSAFADFTYNYIDKHSDENFIPEITDKILADFEKFIKKPDYEYTSKGENELDSLIAYESKMEYDEDILDKLNDIKKFIDKKEAEEFIKNKESLKKELKAQFILYKYGSSKKYEFELKTDPIVLKAIEVLKDRNTYHSLLSIGNERRY